MKRILVVEDDALLRDSIATALEIEGYKVFLAVDGGDAWAQLSAMPPPDLILTDLSMHPIDGRTFLKKKNESPLLKGIPVIVISSEDDTCDIKELVLKKPFDLDRFFHAVATVILKAEPAPVKKRDEVS